MWCLIASDDIWTARDERGTYTPRTLQGIQADHREFLASGGDLKKAKHYNNVIDTHFLDINLDHVSITNNNYYMNNGIIPKPDKVCLPGLHITLGVFLKLFTLLEDECYKLDLEMASVTGSLSGDRPGYVDYSATVHRERALLDEKTTVEGELKWLSQTLSLLSLNASDPSTDTQVLAVANFIQEKELRKTDIVSNRMHKDILMFKPSF